MTDPSGLTALEGFVVGAIGGGLEGLSTGAQGFFIGAVTGGVAGAVVGAINPFESYAAGVLAGDVVGGFFSDILSPSGDIEESDYMFDPPSPLPAGFERLPLPRLPPLEDPYTRSYRNPAYPRSPGEGDRRLRCRF
jgi:hypothetical protein